MAIHRHVRGSKFHGLLVMMGTFGAIAAMFAAAFVERARRLIVDLDADELVVENVALLRRTSEQTVRLSKIERARVEDIGEAFQLFVTIDGKDRPVMRSDASDCQRAAALIQATIDAR